MRRRGYLGPALTRTTEASGKIGIWARGQQPRPRLILREEVLDEAGEGVEDVGAQVEGVEAANLGWVSGSSWARSAVTPGSAERQHTADLTSAIRHDQTQHSGAIQATINLNDEHKHNSTDSRNPHDHNREAVHRMLSRDSSSPSRVRRSTDHPRPK